MGKDLTEGRGVTLNSLRDEQRSLNMRMLLAVQTRDQAAQEALRRELEEITDRIERLLSRLSKKEKIAECDISNKICSGIRTFVLCAQTLKNPRSPRTR